MDYYPVGELAKTNTDFRRVLWTGKHTQLVIMTLPPWVEIGLETHEENDQILTFISGTGTAFVGGKTKRVGPGDVVCVPAGTPHNFTALKQPLVLTTIYGPPDHPEGTVNKTKADAERAELAENK